MLRDAQDDYGLTDVEMLRVLLTTLTVSAGMLRAERHPDDPAGKLTRRYALPISPRTYRRASHHYDWPVWAPARASVMECAKPPEIGI